MNDHLVDRRRRRGKGEAGQVAPLAAIGIFIMALMVLATMNLGKAVHQKIKLQNTADSAAYTLAAMEARTFNYIAFLNRVQLAHYNTAMAIQSLNSWVGYHVSVAAASHDMLASLKGAIDTGAKMPCTTKTPMGCPYKAAKPTAKAAVTASRQMLNQLVDTYKAFARHAHQYAQAMAVFNKDVIWHAQLVRAGLLNIHLLTGMQNYIQKLDSDLSFTGKSALLNMVVNAALNSYEYYNAFDASGGVNAQAVFGLMDYLALRKQAPFPGYIKPKARMSGGLASKVTAAQAKEAYKVMAELANATRYPKGVTDRTNVTVEAINQYANTILGTTWVSVLAFSKMGQAKLTKRDSPKGGEIKAIRQTASGDAVQLSSDDFASDLYGTGNWNLNLGWPGYATVQWVSSSNRVGSAIAAYDKKVDHTLYAGTKKSSTSTSYAADGNVVALPMAGPKSVKPIKIDPAAGGGGLGGAAGSAASAVSKITGDSTSWPGFAPFFRFRANKERTSDYGQPSTWIFLNKSHKDFQSDVMKRWGFNWGTLQGELDGTIGGKRNSYLFEGVNVIARGLVYYHRPGNWGEHPNFFNPFWRARLAPVGQKLQNFFDKYVSGKITSSSQDPKAKAIVAGVKNVLGDAFTAIVTSLIAH